MSANTVKYVAVWSSVAVTAILGVVAVLAALTGPFYETFKAYLFWAGFLLMVVGGSVGSGMTEAVYNRSHYMLTSSAYIQAVNDERRENKRARFYLTVTCFVLAILVMAVSAVLP